jgi:hypothetical protein
MIGIGALDRSWVDCSFVRESIDRGWLAGDGRAHNRMISAFREKNSAEQNISWTGTRFDPRTGSTTPGRDLAPGKRESFTSPGDGDWVLVLDDGTKPATLPAAG